jgi:hypothetical protein
MEYLWSTYGIHMEFLWNNTVPPPELHRSSTLTAGWVLAGNARAAQQGAGEVPKFNRWPKPAQAEGFGGWTGRGRKETAMR